MKRGSLTAAPWLWALLLALLPAGVLAQGVTTSAISGTVTNQQNQPVAGAQIVATNTATGAESRVVTRADGRYLLQGLAPGGPYRITARGLGYALGARTNVTLVLSQTARFDFVLAPEAVAIEGLTVEAERNTVISRSRTGTATVVSDSAISRLPTITRDFTDFTRLTPQISTAGEGSNAGGRNSKFNSIQIDGAANNDLFGLNPAGTPGSGSDARPISLEAIKEFQVVLAPFDVRQGGFTGAGINAVTKSGTNEFEGTVTYFNRNEALVGNFVFEDGEESADFEDFKQNELGFSFGGPIIKDRLHFFLAGEVNRRSAPINNVAGTPTSNVPLDSVTRVAGILEDQYGYNPGATGSLPLKTDGDNLFGRLDWSINDNHRFTLRHNYLSGLKDDLARSNSTYYLGGSLFVRDNTTHSTVAQLNSTLGSSVFNEFRVGYSTINDERVPQDRTPSVRVFVGSGLSVFGGSEQFSGQNILEQDVLELTNDLTFARGQHNFTVGTHNEFFSFSNLFVRNAYGYYEFANPAALAAGTPNRYEYSYLLPEGNERAEFDVRQHSFYVQDQIDVSDRVTVTAGIRYDVVNFPEAPGTNPEFATRFLADSITVGGRPNLAYGRSTGEIPSGNGLWNPRIGFNWDVNGDRSLQVRGGLGLFSGRTPYVWLSNAYGNTGLDYVRFTCTGAATPLYSEDPAAQPTNCAGATNPAANELNLADPDFELPQVFRASFAVDRDLPFGFIGTAEWLYTKTRNDVLYQELNLGTVTGYVEGRPRYSGRRTNFFSNVTDITNTDEGYNYSLTAQVQRPFRDGWDFSAAYTFTKARDVTSVTSSQAFSNWRFNPIDNNPNDPSLRPANFEVPHRIVASGSKKFEFLKNAPLDLSLIYTGESGRPYSYTYLGDVNNDGSNGNDLIFVPANESQIRFTGTAESQAASWQNLNTFIEGVECLREARGEVLKRNACRQPWLNRFDVRLAQTVPTIRGQGVQVMLNVINFANLLNKDWGKSEFVTNQADQVLQTSSTANVNGRVTFQPFGAGRRVFNTSNINSRYQIQLGLRYSF